MLVAGDFILQCFITADWRRYFSTIALRISDLDAGDFRSTQDIDDALDCLTLAIQDAGRSCIPRKRRQFGTFGLTPEILSLIGQRKSAIRGWQRTRDPAVRECVRRLNLEIERATERLANRRFGRAVQRLNDDPGSHRRKFWRLVRNIKKRPSVMPTLQTENGPFSDSSRKV